MKIMVFDTETTSLEKPFCYNIGYVIADSESGEIFTKRDFVVEQIWHNLPLFNSAYYSNKRPIYVNRMKGRKVFLDKFGYICQKMIKDIKFYNVEKAFAFNSSFDEKVFDFNCEWFKCNNPFDTLEVADIRAFAHKHLVSKNYKDFCEKFELFTESRNYSTTAESFKRFLIGSTDFEEEHTALADSEIELEILLECCRKGADLTTNPQAYKSIPRKVERNLKVKKDNELVLDTTYKSMTFYKSKNTIVLKSE